MEFGESPDRNSQTMRRSPRQLWWGGLFLSSLIQLGSTLEAVRMQRYYSPPTSAQQWAVGSAVATFLLAFSTLAMQAVPQTARFLVGTKLELASILVATALSCAAVGAATDPATGMAINAAGGVSFGNLYCSAWASAAGGVGLVASFLRTERGLDASHEMVARGRRFRLHCFLVVSTLIVMGSSASSYDAKCAVQDDGLGFQPSKFCRRAAFGVSMGCIGCVCSLAVVAMRLSCSTQESDGAGIIFAVECISSFLLTFFYGFSVAYITSEEGPGAPLGNLYYSTWATFGLTLFVALSCFEKLEEAKLLYSLRTERGEESSEGGVGSINISDPDLPEKDVKVEAEPNHKDESGSRETALFIGNRSGSVGEVQI